MGLFDSYANQTGATSGGLLGGMEKERPSMPAMLGGNRQESQGGVPPMPQELQQAIAQIKTESPEKQQEFMLTVLQSIQSEPKDENLKQQVMQQFMQAMEE